MNNSSPSTQQRTTVGKALRVNLDSQRYGTFAEIGAGQEVARFFFQAGKASQTIAKTISAYDMTYSDEIYGREANGRYVCESRLNKMLSHEFGLLQERLFEKRGDDTCFFAFADTVATGSESKNCHGWMGLRFQMKPKGPFNDIIMHVRMLDHHRLQQQETLGVLGVNLMTAAFYALNPYQFIDQLIEGLQQDSLAIDVIHLLGPDAEALNEKRLNLELVKKEWADGVFFTPDFKLANTADAVYGKALLIQRGKFRPVTTTHIDIFSKGQKQLEAELVSKNIKANVLPLMEMTMTDSHGDAHVSEEDFLQRIECLCALGHSVIVTKFKLFYELKQFFRQYNKNPMAIVVGAYHLDKLFEDKYYTNLSGGMLEGLGRLLDAQTKVYIYPHKTENLCVTVGSYFPNANIKLIYQHFKEQKYIQDISGCDEISSYIHSHDVLQLKNAKDVSWEKHVPTKVKELILKKNFFNN